MSTAADVVAAAERRASALAARDADELRELLHPQFRWTSFRGEVFDRHAYIKSNTQGRLVWHDQRLDEIHVAIAGTSAVLTAVVTDDVERDGKRETFRLRLTQVWILGDQGWTCIAGHAGPRLE